MLIVDTSDIAQSRRETKFGMPKYASTMMSPQYYCKYEERQYITTHAIVQLCSIHATALPHSTKERQHTCLPHGCDLTANTKKYNIILKQSNRTSTILIINQNNSIINNNQQ